MEATLSFSRRVSASPHMQHTSRARQAAPRTPTPHHIKRRTARGVPLPNSRSSSGPVMLRLCLTKSVSIRSRPAFEALSQRARYSRSSPTNSVPPALALGIVCGSIFSPTARAFRCQNNEGQE